MKTFLDAISWTVGSQGVTKVVYIYAKSQSNNLDLRRPVITTANHVIIVLYEAPPPTDIQRFRGSDVKSYTGMLTIFAKTEANLESAINALKAAGDTDDNLMFYIPGPKLNIATTYYLAECSYKWDKSISH